MVRMKGIAELKNSTLQSIVGHLYPYTKSLGFYGGYVFHQFGFPSSIVVEKQAIDTFAAWPKRLNHFVQTFTRLDLIQRVCSFLMDPEDRLLLSLLNRDMHATMCTFPSIIIKASSLSESSCALRDGEVAKEWEQALRFLSRRKRFAVKLTIIGTLPIHMIAGIIDNNGAAGGGVLQKLIINESTCEGMKMYVPRALALEDERLLEHAAALVKKYAFLKDMETLDIETSPAVLSAAVEDFRTLKKDATTHFAACSSLGACPKNFGRVVAVCDKGEYELSLISHTFSYYMTVEDLKANLDVIPLSVERLKREVVRWSMLSASMGIRPILLGSIQLRACHAIAIRSTK